MGAFDNVIPEALILLVHKYGLPSKITSYIQATTSRRNLMGYAAGIDLQHRTATRGLPQGSILSPILFNLYIALVHTCLPESVKILVYADITIYHSDENLEHIAANLNMALDNMHRFFGHLGLSISINKSAYTVFSSLRTRNLRILLKRCHNLPGILDEIIPVSYSTRFLGVIFDSELNWKAHINQLKSRVLLRINIFKAIFGIRWGAHPAILINVYKGFIRPLLDWSYQAFQPLAESLYLKTCRLQYAALRTVTEMMCTTPTNALLDINGEQPLRARWHFLTAKLLCKIRARRTHPLNHMLNAISQLHDTSKLGTLVDIFVAHQELFNQIEQFDLPGYLGLDYNISNFKAQIDTDSGLILKHNSNITESFIHILSNLKTEATFFTDGSKSTSEEKVGLAVFSPELNIEFKERINNYCTIYEAEALAISRALDFLIDSNVKTSVIFSDSLSVLNNLKNPIISRRTHPWILHIINSLHNGHKKGLDIRIVWIPSHRGIPGNENADSLAKEALHLSDPFLISKCHYSNIYSKFKTDTRQIASDILHSESLHKGARYFNHIDTILSIPWYIKFKGSLPRPIITLVSRLRIQHTATGGHLWEKNIIDSPRCSCGHHFQDLNHTFFHCKNDQELSDELISSILRATPGSVLDIPTLAFSNNPNIYKSLYSFVTKANLNC